MEFDDDSIYVDGDSQILPQMRQLGEKYFLNQDKENSSFGLGGLGSKLEAESVNFKNQAFNRPLPAKTLQSRQNLESRERNCARKASDSV